MPGEQAIGEGGVSLRLSSSVRWTLLQLPPLERPVVVGQAQLVRLVRGVVVANRVGLLVNRRSIVGTSSEWLIVEDAPPPAVNGTAH